MKIFKNGLITGLLLQLAVGPVFFFIVNLTLQKTILDGFVAVFAVTLVDYLYITLAILGIGKLFEKKKVKRIFSIVSSIVLMIFGVILIKGILGSNISINVATDSKNLLTSFTSVFFLTISSPMTIVFFTSLFTAKTVQYNYAKRELVIFGFATGLATFIFLGLTVFLSSLIKGNIPMLLIQFLNALVGCLLIGYGAVRLRTVLKNSV
ncbi:MAG: Lysine exporter protein (LYSE/YGGA) [Candidatus Wolfebacteria bacterium GW2011_GWE1_48_7]|uniref:Lysine exporter protein LysE/YggA n=1 Tax=Candidatus Wolfebacteria bacterium GW2011_GWB1_47_1 TaxID=1619007 RepID=A0A0G4AQX5_9BACT|nr:MAG: lysine exporter protein LysE/YggA [Candidatus Wolfebacteria bacterium GW2011_GWB1_47_1]KKU41997.1 MAG: Lysine exporter protein (LYSE/YGGA) [Candidatus Wolfebacteria bacterium GW2011_GWB2_46_69]KKU54467.1 MAG: Lysine exporter protein (LYSE/YGGA) [Candidatus Wolfebacteria bacterium GW2011_GWC1_47_103]KKU59794.1 MAG: Lysine exporter protein (LYSE/YGGA) [Candidatus Wolfebacteria bacterium GW2011_GWE2_47_12]KKU65787.1 MAG: Lysine exporter protein (LYSE/YGGA) [Candidatus Wolfebacteria bacteri